MGRKRKSDKHLPERVYVHGNNYRYMPPSGKPIVLAPKGMYADMLRAYANLVDDQSDAINTMNELYDRYELDVIPGKADKTQKDNLTSLARLRVAFGLMRPNHFKPSNQARYNDMIERAKSPYVASADHQLNSHVFTKACHWGYLEQHPIKDKVERPKKKVRQRYVSDQEFNAVLEIAPPMIVSAMEIAYLTGLRRGDVLSLTRRNLTDEGILIKPSKTSDTSGKVLLIRWSDDLKSVVDRALLSGPRIRQYIICGHNGKRYNDKTFSTNWGRLMKLYVANGGERFQFKDLRKKSASDDNSAQDASARLGHSSVEFTNAVYRLKPNEVKPLTRKK